MNRLEGRLLELGHTLPEPKHAVGNYLGSKPSGDLLFVSGRVSQLRGEVGSAIDADTAKLAAQSAMLDILAIVKEDIGDLDRIVSSRRCKALSARHPPLPSNLG